MLQLLMESIYECVFLGVALRPDLAGIDTFILTFGLPIDQLIFHLTLASVTTPLQTVHTYYSHCTCVFVIQIYIFSSCVSSIITPLSDQYLDRESINTYIDPTTQRMVALK